MLLKDFCFSLLLLKNDSIIDSNVTEGIPSLPPVESMVMAYHAKSKVTACHAMCGARSSGDNIREGDVILEVAVDNDKDLYAECHKRGNIIDSNITDGIPSLNPVESIVTACHAKSKVTACHAMPGTRSSGDNIREGDITLEVAVDHGEDLYAECRMWGDIMNSNVTEGIPSFPPVESMVTAYHAESKVTACHAMRGTHSSKNNIKEGRHDS
jgi:ferredoxin